MRITSPTQESQANETFSEVFYFRYFPFPIEREALFSQAFRLTIRAAGPLAGRFFARLHTGYRFAASRLFRIVHATTHPFKICQSSVSCTLVNLSERF